MWALYPEPFAGNEKNDYETIDSGTFVADAQCTNGTNKAHSPSDYLWQTTNERDWYAADQIRFVSLEREYLAIDGRCANLQLVVVCQELWPRDTLDSGFSRHIAFAYAGDVERNEDQ